MAEIEAEKEGAFSDSDRWILISAILASSMAFIDGSALNIALPAIQSSLEASGAQLLWVINAYSLMLAALILTGGSLGDRLGRKKVFMAGISIFSLASLACGISPTIQWLILGRIVQGVGGALMIPGSLAIITASISPERRGRAIGLWSAITTLVTIAGPLLGGFLSDLGLWRGLFFINPPLGVISLIILQRKVPESRDENPQGGVDIVGAALITLGLGGLSYGFISAPDEGLTNPRVFGSLFIGVISLIAFVFIEARLAHPLLPLKLFKSRPFSGTNLLTLLLYGALSVTSFFLSVNLSQVQGYSKTAAGLAFLPVSLLLSALSGWSGRLADRRGPRRLLILGPAVVGLGFIVLAMVGLTRGPVDYWRTFLPGLALFGIGMGLTVAPLTTTVMSSVPVEYSGTASGINNSVSRTAGVLAIAVIGAAALILFTNQLSSLTASLNLSQPARHALNAEAGKLGGAAVPKGVGPQQTTAVERAIKVAFADTFRVVMLICAGLAWLSALFAVVFVKNRIT